MNWVRLSLSLLFTMLLAFNLSCKKTTEESTDDGGGHKKHKKHHSSSSDDGEDRSSSDDDEEDDDPPAVTYDPGNISGIITNAANGGALMGVTVSLGDVSTTTDASGYYELLDVDGGPQTLEISLVGYISQEVPVTIPENDTLADNNISMMSEAYGSGKFVVVVSWAATPRDLDSHLLVPASEGNTEVFYANLGSLDVTPYARLDADATFGNGPETITIDANSAAPHYGGTYKYFVHNWSGDAQFYESAAVVRVYRDGDLIKTIEVNTEENWGRYWYVFDLNSSGQVIERNIVQDAPPAL